jgi:hypothetical protein
MFRYSKDELIASKQQEEAVKLLDEIKASCTLEYSSLLEEEFNKSKMTYDFMEDFAKLTQRHNEPIIFVVVPRNHSAYHSKMDLKRGFDKLDKPWSDPIPYIEYSFPEEYSARCPHGADYMHCYFFFMTKYHEAKGSEDCVKYYLNKVNQLRVFL